MAGSMDIPEVYSVRAEYRADSDSDSVATPAPRLSWKTRTSKAAWTQRSVDIELENKTARTFAEIEGSESTFVAWPFADLSAGEEVFIRIRVTGQDGVTSDWSEPRRIWAGFLDEWPAQFIGLVEPEVHARPFLARSEFAVHREVASATLYATAKGVYQAQINGVQVDQEVLKPGWTPYQYRLIHESTDVTHLLARGQNAIGLSVAGGWFTEKYGFGENAKPFYGDQPSVAAHLIIRFVDGTNQVISTDPTWKVSRLGPVTASGIYAGEAHDARRAQAGWSTAGFGEVGWETCSSGTADVRPTARTSPAVRVIQRVPVWRVIESSSGAPILDFGQNLVGRLRITVKGRAGTQLTVRHAEVLEGGELATRPLRDASATDTYTLAGVGEETWEPEFTFHGFRYAQIENWPGHFDPSMVTAAVIHSDMVRTGDFESSHELVNRLHENVVWGMKGNFLYLPTDCPQRDERLGWTGDIQVFAPTASYLFDANGFLQSWLQDLAIEQRAAGGVPFIVPDVMNSGATPAAAWGDAATIVPWVIYERYGDYNTLVEQFPSMRAWVDQILAIVGDRLLWEGQFQFGDWLDPDSPSDRPVDAKTSHDVVATAYLFRSTEIVAQAARVLGDDETASHYFGLARKIRDAWMTEYTTPAGWIVSDTQTAYTLALQFDLATDPIIRSKMGARLAWLVRSAGYRIGTGFVGTPMVLDALVEAGHIGAASRLLRQTENPSWLFPVTMGATTVWERWDSLLEDGSINPGEMTSFNHYAFGAVADWMHRSLGGLAPSREGYREIRIAPVPLPGFDHARADLETPFGAAAAGWVADSGSLTVFAVVPPNASAVVRLPGATEDFRVGSGEHSWVVPDTREVQQHVREIDLNTSLGEIIDDEEAYDVIWRSIQSVDLDAARSFRKDTTWDGLPLQAELFFMPSAVARAVEVGVARLRVQRQTAATRGAHVAP